MAVASSLILILSLSPKFSLPWDYTNEYSLGMCLMLCTNKCGFLVLPSGVCG